MTNRDLFQLSRHTRPERTTSSVAGEFLFALGLGLLVIVVLSAVIL